MFPRTMFHRVYGMREVSDEDERIALGPGWHFSAAACPSEDLEQQDAQSRCKTDQKVDIDIADIATDEQVEAPAQAPRKGGWPKGVPRKKAV